MSVVSHVSEIRDLTRHDRAEMLRLMESHYEQVDPAGFAADLAEKTWVIRILDRDSGALRGFSTQMVLRVQAGGQPIAALFSGDTIIDKAHWGDQALSGATGRLMWSLIDHYPGEEPFWFLISQGYKTYRFLPVFFHEFYPRHDRPTPPRMAAVIDALARAKFPREYAAGEGIIRPQGKQYRLRAGIAEVTPQRLRDPHVRYFVERNPGHAIGHELCCVAPLTRHNFTDAAHRVMHLEASAVGAT